MARRRQLSRCSRRAGWCGIRRGVTLGGNDRRRRDEPVTTFGNRLDESWIGGVVTESGPDFRERDDQALVEFDERVVRPQTRPQLLAQDEIAVPLEKGDQNAKRLFLDADDAALPEQSARSYVHLELAKPVSNPLERHRGGYPSSADGLDSAYHSLAGHRVRPSDPARRFVVDAKSFVNNHLRVNTSFGIG